MAIVAKAYWIGDIVIPIPFDFLPSKCKPTDSQDIIVAVADSNDGNSVCKKAYNYYGRENCGKFVAEIPSSEKPVMLLCVSSRCLMNKISDTESTFPDPDISPMWTEERYGMTENEAVLVQKMDDKTMLQIRHEMNKYRKKLDGLKIHMDNDILKLIYECRQLVEQAQEYEARASKECRENTAEEVAKFMERSFPVKTWVENDVEPVVAFRVDQKIADENALIIGQAIDHVMSDIDPEESRKFFDVFVYDASSWPVVVNRSFDADGVRRTDYQ